MKGLGCIIYLDDRIYEGEIDNGAMEGIGRFKWPDGKFYYGQYENNVKSGFGIFVWNKVSSIKPFIYSCLYVFCSNKSLIS